MAQAIASQVSHVILLVDDEEGIRKLVRRLLESWDYTVLDASDGVQGLAICRDHQGPIHLLLSDVTMPELDGPAMAAGARPLRPDMRVMFMSGYAEAPVSGLGLPRAEFLRKPFTIAALEKKVQECLVNAAAA
jgi:CheY-like chemotaxis protein